MSEVSVEHIGQLLKGIEVLKSLSEASKLHSVSTKLSEVHALLLEEYDNAIKNQNYSFQTLEHPSFLMFPKLNMTEQRICDALLEGLITSADIANKLFVQEAYVRNCLSTIYKKLGVAGKTDLLTYLKQKKEEQNDPSNQP